MSAPSGGYARGSKSSHAALTPYQVDSALFASPIVLAYESEDFLWLDDHKEVKEFGHLITNVCNSVKRKNFNLLEK